MNKINLDSIKKVILIIFNLLIILNFGYFSFYILIDKHTFPLSFPLSLHLSILYFLFFIFSIIALITLIRNKGNNERSFFDFLKKRNRKIKLRNNNR
jgi:hypothetical protein